MARSNPQRLGISAWTGRLRTGSRRVTGQRAAILSVLERARRPMTHKEIWSAIDSVNCDLATVYRSVRLLEQAGIVRRCQFGSGGAKFELHREDDHPHGHHLVCNQCAEVIPVRECFPEQLQSEIARRSGFVQVTHRLEFFGICPRCQSS